MDQKKTGYFLKQLRNEKKLTQEQLAEKIGVSIETISSIERGIKMPRLQNFVAIANQLGVSRTPIREAIRMLELDGLVIMVPRKGAQVAQITEKDLNDVLEVRLGLEELAVKLACQRITESELQKLYQASRSFEQMLETTETDDLQKLAQADVAFHDVIYQATNNERLIQLLNNLREQMYRYRIEYLKDVKSRRSLVEEHDALYERMKNRDLAGAQKMIREHIERQQESIMQTVHHQSMTGVEEK